MRWRNWNWLELGLMPILMAVMRACWLVPWLALIQRFFAIDVELKTENLNLEPSLGMAVIVAVPLLSFWLSRFVTAQLPDDQEMATENRVSIPLQSRLLLGGGGLATLLFVLWWQFAGATFPLWDLRWFTEIGQVLIHVEELKSITVWISLFTLIFLWLRGLLDAGRSLGHDDVWSAMSTGVAAIILYLLATNAFGSNVQANFSNLIVLFFGAGMAALAFSGIKVTVGLNWALSGSRRSAKAPPITRYWLISVGVVVGGLLGLGTAIGLLVAPEQVARLLATLNGVAKFLWMIVSTIILSIAYVVFFIVYYIMQLLSPLIERILESMGELANLLPPENGEELTPQEPLTTTLASVPDGYRWVGLLIFLIIVGIIFALVIRRLRRAQEVESDEVRESILSSDLLQDQLARLWNRLWGSGRKEGEFDPFLSLDGENETRRSIRQVYQQLLSASGARGLARQKAQTPAEYQTHLAKQVQVASDPLERVTERYIHARYAPEPPDAASADEAQQAWQSIEPLLVTPVEGTEKAK